MSLRLPFKLLTNDTSVGGYANAASRLVLFVIRDIDSNQHSNEVNAEEYKEVDGTLHSVWQASEIQVDDEDMDRQMEELAALWDDELDDGSDEGLYDDLDEDLIDDGEDEDFEEVDLAGDAGWDGGDMITERAKANNSDEKKYPIILTDQQHSAMLRLRDALNTMAEDQKLVSLFHDAVMSIFVSQPKEAEGHRLHLPIEAYIIGSNLCPDGSIKKPVNVANGLSKLQYSAQFAVLRDALASEGDVSEYVLYYRLRTGSLSLMHCLVRVMRPLRVR